MFERGKERDENNCIMENRWILQGGPNLGT